MKSFARALGLTLTSSLLVFANVALASNVHGVLRVVKGEVQVKSGSDGSVAKAKLGAKVFPKDTVITGKDARAKIVMVDNNEINISPESQIVIQNYEFDPKAGKKEVLLNVIYGKVRSKVEQKYDGKTSHFQVKTPSAVAGVRGTDFITGFNRQNNTSSVVTFQGKVEFGIPGPNGAITNSVSVTPGNQATSSGGQAPSSPTPVPKEELSKMDNDSKADTPDKGKQEGQPSNQEDKKEKKEEKKEDSEKKAEGEKKSDDGEKRAEGEKKSDDGGKKAEGERKSDDSGKKAEGEKKTDDGGKKAEGEKKADGGNKQADSNRKQPDGQNQSDSKPPSSNQEQSNASSSSGSSNSGGPSNQQPSGSGETSSSASRQPSTSAPANPPPTGSDRGPASVNTPTVPAPSPASTLRPEDFAGNATNVVVPTAPAAPIIPVVAPPVITTPTTNTTIGNDLIMTGKGKLIINIRGQ